MNEQTPVERIVPRTRLLGFLDDRFNPILVKEVRQSLRGKFFRISFLVVLAGLTILASSMIINMGSTVSAGDGRAFFLSVFGCLAVAMIGLIPFTAFTAMGAEWDENTYDLLIISNLRPRQIVLGKLLSGMTQGLLYYSAFAPFLALAFLLRGVDLLAAAVALAGLFVVSSTLTVLALFASTFAKVRFARVIAMAMLGGILFGSTAGSIGTAAQLMSNANDLRDPDAIRALIGFLLTAGAIASFFVVVACNILSHPEENRSTGLRILTSAVTLLGMAFASYALWLYPDREGVSVVSLMMVGLLAIPSIFFTTEPDALGRRVAPRVPKSRLAALLLLPWLPGGNRGVLYVLLHLALIHAFLYAWHLSIMSPGDVLLDDGVLSVSAAGLYLILYVGLPSALAAPFTKRPVMRGFLRAAIPVGALLFALVPAFVGFLIGNEGLMEMEHVGNPFQLMFDGFSRNAFDKHPLTWAAAAVLGTLAVLVNVLRMGRGIGEVTRASAVRARRKRDADRATSPDEGAPGDALPQA